MAAKHALWDDALQSTTIENKTRCGRISHFNIYI